MNLPGLPLAVGEKDWSVATLSEWKNRLHWGIKGHEWEQEYSQLHGFTLLNYLVMASALPAVKEYISQVRWRSSCMSKIVLILSVVQPSFRAEEIFAYNKKAVLSVCSASFSSLKASLVRVSHIVVFQC